MEAKDLPLNQRSKREIIKQVGKVLPHVCGTILTQTFVIKTVHLRDLSALMVSSENGNTMSVPHFQSHKKRDSLHGEIASVNVVSHEQVVGVWGFASDFEQFNKIVELAVDIATYCHWERNWLYVRL